MPGLPKERRAAVRARTRLRPGKLLDTEGRFLADCAILDRSPEGARIRLFEPLEFSGLVQLLDEGEKAMLAAETIWHRQPEAGLRLHEEEQRLGLRELLSVAGPYYAVR